MSVISCDACNNLREYAPEFVQNGVNENVAASLKNNTGLNPSLTVLHDNCEDLNDVNDCLIGRMTDELEAYDVCDWKDFMQKHNSNLYETLKAIIASDCGLWIKLCTSIDALLRLVSGVPAYPHKMTPTATFRSKFRATVGSSSGEIDVSQYYAPTLLAEFRGGVGCNVSQRIHVWSVGLSLFDLPFDPYPYVPTQSVVAPLAAGDILGSIRKSDVVPGHMTEAQWESLMRGGSNIEVGFSLNLTSRVFVRLEGYIVIDGVEFNPDLRSEFGPDVMVMRVVKVESDTTGSVYGPGDVNHVSWA